MAQSQGAGAGNEVRIDLSEWRELDKKHGGSVPIPDFEEAVRRSRKVPKECEDEVISLQENAGTGALEVRDGKMHICCERLFAWLLDESPAHFGHDFSACSVYHWREEIVKKVTDVGLMRETATVYDIDKTIIRAKGATRICPRDGKVGTAYVDCISGNDHVGKAVVMLSYAWKYRLVDIQSGLEQFCEARDLDIKRVYVWLCCLCVNQHRVAEAILKNEEVPFDTFKEVFRNRVEGIGRVLALMAPWEKPEYITRVWCDFELFSTMQLAEQECRLYFTMPLTQQKSLLDWVGAHMLKSDGVDAMWKTLASVDVSQAEASFPGDKQAIMSLINEKSSPHAVNATFSRHLQGWITDTCDTLVRQWARESKQDDIHQAWLLLNVGSLLRKIGRGDMLIRAERALKEAEVLLTRVGDGPDKADPVWPVLLHELGYTYMDLGKKKEAKDALEAAKEKYTAQGKMNEQAAIRLVSDLANFYRKFEYKKELREAVEQLETIDGESHRGLSPKLKAKIKITIGDTKRSDKAYERAMELFSDAYKLLTDDQNIERPMGADLLMSMGIVLQDDPVLNKKKYPDREVEKLFFKAKEIREKSATLESPGGAKLMSAIANMFLDRSEKVVADGSTDEEKREAEVKRKEFLDKAKNAGKQAKNIFEHSHSEETMAAAFLMLTLGKIYEGLKDYQDAYCAYQQSRRTYTYAGHKGRFKALKAMDRVKEKIDMEVISNQSVAVPKDGLLVVTWNIGARFFNPFEFWITYKEGDEAYYELMRKYEKFVKTPGDKDVPLHQIFPDFRVRELIDLMRSARLEGCDYVEKAWKDKYRDTKFVGGFLTCEENASKKLFSLADLYTSSISLKGSAPPQYRPSVTTHYAGNLRTDNSADLLSTDHWWMRWRNFMFHEVLELHGGGKAKTRPYELVMGYSPLRGSPNVTEDERKAWIPLQLLCLALYDCAVLHIMEEIEPDGNWQKIKFEVTKETAKLKQTKTIRILRDNYSAADVICLQKVPMDYLKMLESSFGMDFHLVSPVSPEQAEQERSSTETYSVLLLRKQRFPSQPRGTEALTRRVIDAANKKSGKKQLKPGALLVTKAFHASGLPFIMASFRSDGSGKTSKPVSSAIDELVKDEENSNHCRVRLIFGIDANTVDHTGDEDELDVRSFREHCFKVGLRSCAGHRPEKHSTTCKARTYLQPQYKKSVTYARKLVDDCNPRDHILIRKGTFRVEAFQRDNSGMESYKEAQNIPSLEFPSDHAIVVAGLGLLQDDWEMQELRNNLEAALGDGRLEALVSALNRPRGGGGA